MDPRTFKGDLLGAGAAAIITIPLCIAYGLIAFAPLGSGFAVQAAFIGILSAFFTCLAASLFGGTPVMITAPTAALTLVTSSIVGFLAASPLLSNVPNQEAVIIGLVSLSVLTAGIVQLIFSAFRFGNLVKYVPYPVMAGFMNGIAVLLILKQIRPFVGAKYETHLLEILSHPEIIEPLTCLVGVATLLMVFLFSRWMSSVPGSFIGMLGGTALYYGIRQFSGPESIGPTIGRIDFQFIKPLVFEGVFGQITHLHVLSLVPTLLISGVMLGLVGSMESLLSAVLADDLTGSRHNSNKELFGQGIGNSVSALFGCMPGAGSIAKTLDNYRAGGRTHLSGILTPVLIIIITILLGPYIGMIPLSVFAAIVIVMGIEMVDEWTVHLLRQLSKMSVHRKSILGNLSIVFAVTIIMISVNLVIAIGIGIVIASILFISKMGKSSVRRQFLGNQIRSKKVRGREDSQVLEKLGHKIVVFELHGPIFFGSGDHLVKEIHETMKDACYCILDLKRVNEIDSTGAKSILRACRALRKENKNLLISYLGEDRPLRDFLSVLGFEQEFGEDWIFPDTDTALEAAENGILRSEGLKRETEELELGRLDILKDFTEDEIDCLEKRLVRSECLKDERVIGTMEISRELFFLTHGSVSIRIPLSGSSHSKRLATFSAGAIFGEMAFLDGAPRSAEVLCDENSVIYRLPYEDFKSLSREEPEVALKLIKNIAIEVSHRLRTTSLEIGFLEEH